jgi:hypothetical protein
MRGPTGPQGIQGETGPTGAQGERGPQGISIKFKGVVPTVQDLPVAGSSINDAYVVTETGDMYVWSASYQWQNIGHVVGPQGDIGPTGPSVTGPTGAHGVYEVTDGAPTNPVEGDVWFDSANGKTYIYFQTAWVEITGHKVGPTGPTGPQGIQGIPGPTGPIGHSIPTGGTTGQVLIKLTDNEYDYSWSDINALLHIDGGTV